MFYLLHSKVGKLVRMIGGKMTMMHIPFFLLDLCLRRFLCIFVLSYPEEI